MTGLLITAVTALVAVFGYAAGYRRGYQGCLDGLERDTKKWGG